MKNEIAWLKENFPLSKPVKIWLVPYKKYFGIASETKTHFIIKIARRLDFISACDTLRHEWSHCLTFNSHPDHSDAWARKYGQIIRRRGNEEEEF